MCPVIKFSACIKRSSLRGFRFPMQSVFTQDKDQKKNISQIFLKAVLEKIQTSPPLGYH